MLTVPRTLAATVATCSLLSAAVAEKPWARHIIDDSSRGADGVRLADVNGDGLPDVATGWEEGGVTRVCINPGPGKASRRWEGVTVGKTPAVEDAVLVDLDSDGRMDVVTCCEGGSRSIFVHWAPADPKAYLDPDAWATAALPAAQKKMRWMFAAPADIDGRHGVDLLAAGKNGAAVGWFQAPQDPRDLSAWRWHKLTDAAWIMTLLAADMDGDGDADALVTERRGKGSGCYWLANPGPGEAQKRPWPMHRVGPTGKQTMFLARGDLDNDGLEDLLVATKPRLILCHHRLDRTGLKWRTTELAIPEPAGSAKALAVGDIDLDGRNDVVFTCEGASKRRTGMMWLAAPAEETGEWLGHDIAGPRGIKYDLVELLDLDADGDLDAMTCEERDLNAVIWYENPVRQPSPAD